MNTVKTLERATRLSRRINHNKGQMYRGGTPSRPQSCCAIGLLHLASSGKADGPLTGNLMKPDVREAVALAKVVAFEDENYYYEPSLYRWNDRPRTEKKDVVQVIDAAYVLALQEQGIEPEDVL
jgi:hypothetical protein